MIRFYCCCFALICLFSGIRLVAQCPITVSAGEDIYVCSTPSMVQLDGSIDGDFLNFSWTPTNGMVGSNTLNPTVTVNQTTTYTLTGRAVDWNNNLVQNGDFEQGNSGFSSDYLYSPGDLWPEGRYDIIPNPQLSHTGFAPCEDHTSGSGNMMVVNGAGTPNQNVWCQTVSVTPNTQYAFSAWVCSVVGSSPAQLQFSINGATIGPIISAPTQTCVWLHFTANWNSGSNSSATICIVNQNTVLGGNDFALDDIVFAPVCQVTDMVTVNVVNIVAAAAPIVSIIPCEGSQLTLTGNGSSTGANISYNWDTGGGNIVSGGNTLNPVVDAAGTYTLTVTFDNGFTVCEKTATVTVIENPNPLTAWILPPQSLGCGASQITLFGNSSQSGFSTYQWSTTDGNIVSGATSKNCVIDEPGVYALVVTNTSTGCTATTEVTVSAATNPPLANATAGSINCIQTQTTLSGLGSSTGANITYAWTTGNGLILSGQNQQNALAGSGGTYILAVTNTSNNCIQYDTVTVAAHINPPAITIQPAGVIDCDTDTLQISSGVTPAGATLSWAATNGGHIVSGQNTLTPLIDATGAYILTAVDTSNGCTSRDTAIVIANLSAPVALVQPADSITCQQPSITLSGTGSSSGAGIVYAWAGSNGGNIVSGDTTLNPLVNAPGTYTLLVTNLINACTHSASVQVAADTNIVLAVANAPDTLYCDVAQVTLNTNGSSTGATLTYNWTTADGSIVGPQNIANPLVDAPGTYQLLITNTANGCSATDVAVVNIDVAQPPVQITTPDELTCSHPTQVLQAQAPAGQFTYTWTTSGGGNIVSGDNTLQPLVNTAGTYTLLVTNNINGCTATASASVVLEVGTPSAVAATPGVLNCSVTALALQSAGSSAGSNFTYQWTSTGATGNIVSGADSPAPVVDAPGDYALLVTNTDNGCTATDTVQVTENIAAPPANAGADGVLTCTTPVYQLVANAGVPAGSLLYQWQSPDGNFTGNPAGSQVGADAAGTYVIAVTDASNGCTTLDTLVLTANQTAPVVQITPPALITCSNPQAGILASATGNLLSYSWQTTDGQIVGGQNSAALLTDAAGTYNITVTDGQNGCTQTASAIVQSNTAAPDVSIGPAATITCATPLFALPAQNNAASATYSYQWQASGGGNIVGSNTVLQPQVNAGGTYDLTVTDTGNGCISVLQTVVAQNTVLPQANAGADQTLNCNLNSLIINGTGSGNGNLNFSWTASGGGNIVSGGNTATPQINAAGTYTLLITDTNNGCTHSDAVQVFNDANAPISNAGAPDTLTCSLTQTTLNGSGSTGTGFTYAWTASGGGNIVSGGSSLYPVVDAPGQYQLLVTNLANGCTAISSVVVGEDVQAPVVDAGLAAVITCEQTTLTLAGSASAPGNNLSYNWQSVNGQILGGGNTLTPLIGKPGNYILSVVNLLNGCSSSDNVQVSIDTLHPAISIAPPATLTCLLTSTGLSGQVQQPAAGGYNVAWVASGNGNIVSGANSLTPQVDAPGTYILTVKNTQNGCITTTQTLVSENVDIPPVNAGAAAVITCDHPQVNLSGNALAGGLYQWTGTQIISGGNTLAPLIGAAGVYTLQVTDPANGCTNSAQTTVTENTTPPVVAILSPGTLTCLATIINIHATGSSSGANFVPNWTTANGNILDVSADGLLLIVDQPGDYTLAIENENNGCTASATIEVLQNITLPGVDAGPGFALHCNLPEGTLQGSSNIPNAGFSWTTVNGSLKYGSATAQPIVDAPGSYLLTVVNPENGCLSTDSVTIGEIPLPAFTIDLNQPDCLDPEGLIVVTQVTGGAEPFEYSFDGGQHFQDIPEADGLEPGVYNVVVRDAKGCTVNAAAELVEPFEPTVALPDFIRIDLGDSTVLIPEPNILPSQVVSWQWTPTESLSCADCPYPFASPLHTTTYGLVITDEKGCTATADVQVRVSKQRIVYAPNIFSPNGDGQNDVFTIYGRSIARIKVLSVFDRWGNQIFTAENIQANDEASGWKGTYRGQTLNPAVFVWHAVVEFIDGETELLKGDVTIK